MINDEVRKMFKDPFEGKQASTLNSPILVLGESHHDNNENDNFTTQVVVNTNYKNNPTDKKYKFFHRIAKSFGIIESDIDSEFINFWDYIYFANYIDELCGIGDNRAKKLVKDHKCKYNNELLDFINHSGVTHIFVFSRLVYNELPPLKKGSNEKTSRLTDDNLTVNGKRDWIEYCEYKSISHPQLNHDICVYSMRHPSCRAGFNSENYRTVLGNEFKKLVE